MSALVKILEQQEGKQHTDVWMVGQQLKGILRANPSLEEIMDKDLDVKEMSLACCARKIKAWADEQHKQVKGNCVCVPPDVAESIIREFYGLPAATALPAPAPSPVPEEDNPFDFSTFL